MTQRKTKHMKIFQTVRKNLATIDFSVDQRWYDMQQLRNIGFSILADVLQGMYVFRVADTPEQLMNSAFLTSSGTLLFFSYISIISEMSEIFFLLDKIEKVVNKREFFPWLPQMFNVKVSNEWICPKIGLKRPTSKAMYERANELSEKFSKIIYFVIVDIAIPLFVAPKVILSYFLYFTTDAGNEAFELPIPIW